MSLHRFSCLTLTCLCILLIGCGPTPNGINAASVRVTENFLEIRIPLDEKTWGGTITLDQTAARQLAINLKTHNPLLSRSQLRRTPGAFGVIFPYDVPWLTTADGTDKRHLDYVIWTEHDLKSVQFTPLPCFIEHEFLELEPPHSPQAIALSQMIQHAHVNCANGVRVAITTDQQSILIMENWLLKDIAEHRPTHLEVYVNTVELGLLTAKIPVLWDFKSEGKPSLTPPADLPSKINLAPTFDN